MPWKNIDTKRAYDRKWASEHRDVLRERGKRHRATAKAKETRQRWREANRARLREYKKNWRCRHPNHEMQSWETRKRYRYAQRYGVTPQQVEQARVDQDGRCSICFQRKELVVDHRAHDKHFRAMLCRACNLMIGYAQENPGILLAGIGYLREHNHATCA